MCIVAVSLVFNELRASGKTSGNEVGRIVDMSALYILATWRAAAGQIILRIKLECFEHCQ